MTSQGRRLEIAVVVFAAAAAAAPRTAPAQPTASPPSLSERRATSDSCNLAASATGRVKSVSDGRTFMLDDGREVRLAAIEVAPMPARREGHRQKAVAATAAQPHDRAGLAAQRALADLVFDREVVLKQAAPATDRYGRIVAFGFLPDAPERSLQDALLAQGHARLAARIEETACLAGLRASERVARSAALGLWADPDYSVQAAARPGDILRQRGRFAVVTGTVVSVRDSGGAIYVNFGRRWSEGFAAVIRKRNAAALRSAGFDPQRFKGRGIEVRGFVEQRNGPRIQVERPEQIAIIEGR
jgi:endonuclease YncB( thermonuclease family)